MCTYIDRITATEHASITGTHYGVCVTGVSASVTVRKTPRNTITVHNLCNGHRYGFRKFAVCGGAWRV